jgi:hypothetical protein
MYVISSGSHTRAHALVRQEYLYVLYGNGLTYYYISSSTPIVVVVVVVGGIIIIKKKFNLKNIKAPAIRVRDAIIITIVIKRTGNATRKNPYNNKNPTNAPERISSFRAAAGRTRAYTHHR